LSATNPIDLTGEEETKEEIKIRLAGLLPGLARWSQLALNAVPNELVDVSLCLFGLVAFVRLSSFEHWQHFILCASADFFSNRMSWLCANSVR
jgi:hypothetical protein